MRHLAPFDPPGILVVEDDPIVRMVAVDFIGELDLPVYEAGDADEAMRVLERQRNIVALFTDINMPGTMDGLELARRVRRERPWVQVVVTSGRGQSLRDIPPGGIFLAKPYRGAQLVRMLREMIGEAAGVH
jgi:two-component system, response regulator PdtaR